MRNDASGKSEDETKKAHQVASRHFIVAHYFLNKFGKEQNISWVTMLALNRENILSVVK